MKRSLLLTALTIALLGGTAFADRHHHRGGWGRSHHGSWRVNAGVVVQPRVVVQQPRVVVVQQPRVVQRRVVVQQVQPVVVQAPANSYWVEGQWQWTGYQWQWQAGHYETYQPQPAYEQGYYDQPAYNDNYVEGSFEAGWSSQPCDH
ncbi:MAG TPA: hypothetical protein VMZ53_17490 [Kofleriaceae bacterium]|nr:hypothetical protein [Kofleriaceae bacterium]